MFNLITLIEEVNSDLSQNVTTYLEDNNVSELYMHKILYILYGNFYTKYKKELFFNADFRAWKYGPVELDYRSFYRDCKKDNKIVVPSKFNINLNSDELKFVKKEINHLLQFSPWSLVDFTHTTEAWIDYYKEEENNKIPISAIQESFTK